MEYVSNFNINQCKKYAYNTQSAYFSVNNIDDERECYVGDNLNSLIKDGEILEATEGVVIIRKNSNGILSYFKPKNPFN